MPNPIQILSIILLVFVGAKVQYAQKPPKAEKPPSGDARAEMRPIPELSIRLSRKPSGPVLSLDTLVKQALEKNPEIEAARQRVAAAKAAIGPAGALDDPRIGAEQVTGRSDTGENMLMLRQMFPGPGKRSTRTKAARQELLAAEYELAEKQNQVVRDVKTAYYGLYSAAVSIEITERMKELLQSFADIAAARYEVGAGLQQDVLRAHVAVSGMVNELLAMQREKAGMQATLNAALGRRADEPLDEPGEIAPGKEKFEVHALISQAEKKRPALLSMATMVEREKTTVELARKELRPDFELGVNYMALGMDQGVVSGNFMMTLPWVYAKRKQRKMIEEAEAKLQAATKSYEAMRNEVSAQSRDTFAALDASDRQLSLLSTGLLPQSELALASARAVYQTGQVDFLTLLDSLMTVYRYQLDYHRLVAQRQSALARLEAVVGESLETKQ